MHVVFIEYRGNGRIYHKILKVLISARVELHLGAIGTFAFVDPFPLKKKLKIILYDGIGRLDSMLYVHY